MNCSKTGLEHLDSDFDGAGVSTTGCDCVVDSMDDLDSTPTEEGPEGEESYESPRGDIDEAGL